jgi:flagellar protein FliL
MASETAGPTGDDAAAKPKKSKKMLFIIVGVVLIAAAAWFFMLRPSGGKVEKKPGEVVTMEPIQINLADGHYLRLGLTLQMTTASKEADGSKALDSAIGVFSGLPKEKLLSAKVRAHLKKELLHDLDERYEGSVMDVYFTDFVTQ